MTRAYFRKAVKRRPSTGADLGLLVLRMKAAGLPTPETEVRFDPVSKWRFDYAWGPPWWIALEVEGGIWSGGRHVRGLGYEADCRKYNQAAIARWCVIRATTGMVADGTALRDLRAAFSVRGLE